MRVMVTGSSGFIGRAVKDELERRGHEVIQFDAEHGRDVAHVLPYGSVRGVSHVIHLAGVLGTAELFDSPRRAVTVNVGGTLNVLQACEEVGAGYTGITMPQTGWCNVYQATKGCAQELALAWNVHRGVPVSHVRAFNVFGPGQKLGPVRKMVPTFARAAWLGDPVQVWGDGQQVTDLVHAPDVARMLCDAIAFGNGEVFDAGTGKATTVNEAARMIIAMAGRDPDSYPVEHHPMRPGETIPALADLPIALGDGWDKLGWQPQFREEDLAATVAWYKGAD